MWHVHLEEKARQFEPSAGQALLNAVKVRTVNYRHTLRFSVRSSIFQLLQAASKVTCSASAAMHLIVVPRWCCSITDI